MRTYISYGREKLPINVPDDAVVLAPASPLAVPVPDATTREALERPLGTPPLAALARQKSGGTACIVVSDITRPVPYTTLLPPLLETLEENGIASSDISILIGTGMHRPSTAEEREEMFGPEVCANYRIIDHDAKDDASLVTLPERTSHGTEVSLDRVYMDADLKIVTGLVEPHFMAGYSGGRKGVCPAIVNLKTIQNFHGPGFLEHPNATNGVLEGNPCHEESLDVAHIAGVDFLLNVAMNLDREIVGVFAGDLDEAFAEAVRCVDSYCRADVEEEADIVITSGGGYPLDKTLYQVVKGMVGAMPAVCESGTILIAAECSEGIGSREYRDLMHEYSGCHKEFLNDITASPVVRKDQWELEMQCKVLGKVGEDGLILSTRGISREELPKMSLTSGYEYSESEEPGTMLQETIDKLLSDYPGDPKIVVIPEGPYVLTGVGAPVGV